jgi:hypothetical protein
MKECVRRGTVLALCLITSGAVAAAATDPVGIVKKYYAAFNAGQFEAAASGLADDAVLTSPEGRFEGKDACRRYLKSLIDRGVRQENSNYREKAGEVRYDYKWYLGGAVVGSGTDGLTIVKDGKVVYDGLEGLRSK